MSPYIEQIRRFPIDRRIDDLAGRIKGPGDLNYAITRLCLSQLDPIEDAGYQDFNEIVGVLECAKMELYRRVLAAYENRKAAENGDVYP